ncbi:MAG: BMC domain-containing protein [Candidatus Delongbacteria bacterium]
MDEALGFVETRGLVAAIEACDAMLKAARVRLVQRQVVNPALITICVEGETSAVQAAVDAGARAAERVGRVVSVLVIPRPAAGVRALAGSLEREAWSPADPLPAPGPTPATTLRHPATPEDLRALPVRELRALARRLPGFPLGGRRISQSTREELLGHLGHLLFSR